MDSIYQKWKFWRLKIGSWRKSGKSRIILAAALVIALAAPYLYGFTGKASCVCVQAAAKKYQVRESYIREIGKNFKSFKKKYKWTLTNGQFTRLAWCNYKVPGKQIHYIFQGDYKSWKMKNHSKCIGISMKAKTLIKGIKGKVTVKKFASNLSSKKKKATWTIGGQAGGEALISFYSGNGARYRLRIKAKNGNSKISPNTLVVLEKW